MLSLVCAYTVSEKKAAPVHSSAYYPAGRHSPATGLSRAGSGGSSTPAHDPPKMVCASALTGLYMQRCNLTSDDGGPLRYNMYTILNANSIIKAKQAGAYTDPVLVMSRESAVHNLHGQGMANMSQSAAGSK